MAVHVARNNFMEGVGRPLVSPKYYGQTYVDTSTTPRTIWISTSLDVTGWIALSETNHVHGLDDIYGLRVEVAKLVQEEGIDSAIANFKDGTNIWTGNNFFDGELRQGGSQVLNKKSSIGDLADVDITKGLDNLTVLGFNGSSFIPMKLDGVSPSDGGAIDFNAYLRKDQLVTNLTTNSDNEPLAASQGAALKTLLENGYAKVGHKHTEYALLEHTHGEYVDKNSLFQEMRGSLIISSDDLIQPLTLRNKYSSFEVRLPQTEDDSLLFSFDGPDGLTNVVFGATDGSLGRRLNLNFSEITLNGKISKGENSKYLQMPSMKLESSNLLYVGDTKRNFGLDLNDSALIGANQIVFGKPSRSRLNGLLFPKEYAGNSKPTDAGLYHHLYMIDNQLITDTALASEKNYIGLNGVRYFFGPTEPGREAREGDVWFKV